MEPHTLLESYLRQLRLPMFVKHYRPFATDAVQQQLDYVRYLLALAEQEVTKREQNRQQMRLKAARFPVSKELAGYDFSLVPSLNKAQVLDLARGDYIRQRHSIILLGSPGLGKTHLAIGLAQTA